jgi:hypothetical protein
MTPVMHGSNASVTRELIDGFGVSGTSGVFTRSCEETLRVLRDNKQALLAIVDVLLHDPLMSWRMSTKKKENVQHKVSSTCATPSLQSSVSNSAHDGFHNRVQAKAPSKVLLLSKRTTTTIAQTRTWCGTRSGTNSRGGIGERCVSLHSHCTSFVAMTALCLHSFVVFWFHAHTEGSLLYLRGQSEWRGR